MKKRLGIIGVITLFFLAPLFSFSSLSVHAAIVINEMLPKTDSPAQQWIELYNNGSESVSLNMWKLENVNGTQATFIINASGIIAPNGFLLFPQSQTNITFNPNGDTIRLIDDKNTIIDSQDFPSTLGFFTTIGRTTNGGGVWAICTTSTPNKPNDCPTPIETPTPTPGPTDSPTPIPPPPVETVQQINDTPIPVSNQLDNVLGTSQASSPTPTPTPVDENSIQIEIPKTITIPKTVLVQMAIIGTAWVLLAAIALIHNQWKQSRKKKFPPPTAQTDI